MKILMVIVMMFMSSSAEAQFLARDAFIRLADKTQDTIVKIISYRGWEGSKYYVNDDYSITISNRTSGSGFVISKKGHILTNAHVVAGAFRIELKFNSYEEIHKAKLIGIDRDSDIALLQIDKATPKFLRFGSSDKVRIGQFVASFGSPFGFENSFSVGVITGKDRFLGLNIFKMIQTDASINSGSSGGPLLNLSGHVIGVNSAIIRGASGVGFAIPSKKVQQVLYELKKYGHVQKAYLGIDYIMNVDRELVVVNSCPTSPADRVGLRVDDIIIEFNKEIISDYISLIEALKRVRVGKTISMLIFREGETVKLNITPQVRGGEFGSCGL